MTKYTAVIAQSVVQNVLEMSKHPFGNYVVQHVLKYASPKERSTIITLLMPYVHELSKHKSASNVVEKCLLNGSPSEQKDILRMLLGNVAQLAPNLDFENNTRPWQDIIVDQYGNYVMQKAIKVRYDSLVACRRPRESSFS